VPTDGDTNATHFGLQLVVNAAWNLRENLRYLLQLHREGQRAIRKQHDKSLTQALSKPAKTGLCPHENTTPSPVGAEQ
jgi:hypothetical protein